jgi:putative ABC transport system permease protein
MMVPLETARRRLMGSMGLPPSAVMQIALTVADAKDLGYVQGEVEALLRQRHKIAPGEDDDFNVRNISEIVATRTATTRLMSLLLGAVATISLIVGGIGIMNIMLISLIGGVLGIAIGIVGALLVGKFSELPVALNGQVIGLAAGFSVATGLFFGYYPARKASQLDPIEALRSQ